MTRRNLSAQWSIDLDDSFRGEVIDGDLHLVSPGPPPRTILLALWYPPAERSADELMSWVMAEVNPDPLERFEEPGTSTGSDDAELRYASWYPETVAGRTQYALYGYVVRRGSYVQSAFYVDDPGNEAGLAAERDWALTTWRSLRYAPEGRPATATA